MMNVQTEEEKSLNLVGEVCSSDISVMRNKIQALESLMMQHEQVDVPVTHRFNGGMYAREITIPKGSLLTGRIHKFDHFDIMLSGDITVSTDSDKPKRLTGLNIMEGKVGKKRAGYAHEDTHWITFHLSEEKNTEDMVEFLTCNTFEELDNFKRQLLVAMNSIAESERLLTEHAETIVKQEDSCQ